MVSGCEEPPTHVLSLRMRRQDTGADWAPNLPAFFCPRHANGGSDIWIRYTPTGSHKNRVRVTVGFNEVNRTSEIRP